MTLPERVERLVAELARALEQGLPQGGGVLEYMRSTHGGDAIEDFQDMLARRDDPDAATLAGLLLTAPPGMQAMLEPELERAACSPGEARQAAAALEDRVKLARAVLPDGSVVEIALEPGDAATFLARLRPDRSPPARLAGLADQRFGPGRAGEVKAMLRQCRLEWSGQREFFTAALLAGLDVSSLAALEALEWALTWLGTLDPEAPAAEMLGAKHLELTARLRRAADFHAALAKSSFEVMMAQGARVSLPHPDAVRGELALLDAVCLAVAGRPGWTLAGLSETDLGSVDDAESLVRALGGV